MHSELPEPTAAEATSPASVRIRVSGHLSRNALMISCPYLLCLREGTLPRVTRFGLSWSPS